MKEYDELTKAQKAQVQAQFSATAMGWRKFSDYMYELTSDGKVLSRKLKRDWERENAVLVRRCSTPEVRIDGWMV